MRIMLVAAPLFAPTLTNARFVPRNPPSPGAMPGITGMGRQPAEPALGRELAKLRSGIACGRSDGRLTKGEARALRREAREIDTLAERYGADGLSDSERREIDMRVARPAGPSRRAARPQGRPNIRISLKNGAAGED